MYGSLGLEEFVVKDFVFYLFDVLVKCFGWILNYISIVKFFVCE